MSRWSHMHTLLAWTPCLLPPHSLSPPPSSAPGSSLLPQTGQAGLSVKDLLWSGSSGQLPWASLYFRKTD